MGLAGHCLVALHLKQGQRSPTNGVHLNPEIPLPSEMLANLLSSADNPTIVW